MIGAVPIPLTTLQSELNVYSLPYAGEDPYVYY